MPTTIASNTFQSPSRPVLPGTGFIRERRLLEYVPFSHATLWRRVKEKTFPAPIKLSERVTVWRLEEVHAWMDEMTAKHRAA
ncbi:MAG: AlpA family phage regulatory protein [Zoogloeaceae bacterium]|nr:AlpA family phage regulatory protein [Zoogloeaceae bacterium]